METFLGYILLFPFLGFLVLSILGAKMNKPAVAWVGVGTIGISALLTIILGVQFIAAPPATYSLHVSYWQWFSVADLSPEIAFYLDSLSMVFIFVITFVGFLIHFYSIEFMAAEEGYARFFAYMNLFIGSMLVLVLANNLVLLYLGWEGVGLCSFLLIGFWYKDQNNVAAAKKAFVVTRIGDTAMAIGLFLLFASFNTLEIQKILVEVPQEWIPGSGIATAGALLLLGGAVGKSAQLPLQTWLPDAMAGPSPVSALIHAATMVTAGVYLIARMHVVFTFSPVTMAIIATIGALTLLIAGFSALVQYDIKKVLAYSTISQIGYMFMALGVGAWSAAVFHFMIHAFFKALLFLGAGAVILVLHHEHNMFKMGGLRKLLPVTFWTYLIGSASLAALPLITAGFYSKDQILWYAWAAEKGSSWLWAAGLLGAFITAVYTFRMVFITFYGENKTTITHRPGMMIKIPLIVLAFFSLFAGFIEIPHNLGDVQLFSDFTTLSLPKVNTAIESVTAEFILQALSTVVALTGLLIAYYYYRKRAYLFSDLSSSPVGINGFFQRGWEFDKLYQKLFVNPIVFLAKINRRDFIDGIYEGIADINVEFYQSLSKSQTGNLRWYLTALTFGIILMLTIILIL